MDKIASLEERKKLKQLKGLMRKWSFSERRFGELIGVRKTMAHELISNHIYPVRTDRKDINFRIQNLIFELSKKKEKGIREKSFLGGVEMELLTFASREKFGLSRDPFVNEIHKKEDIYRLPEADRAYKFLEDIARYQGFAALIGEVGSGKTLLYQKLVEALSGENIRFAKVQSMDKKRLIPGHILDSIAFALTGEKQGSGNGHSLEWRTNFIRDLLEDAIRQNLRICLVIDDAHQIPKDVMRSLKQLYDSYKGYSRQLGILLLGQLELVEMMRDLRLREVTQRCAYFFMRGLVTPGAVKNYLGFKLSRVGGNIDSIFDKEVFKLMEKHATFTYKWDGKNYKICPQLRVQNLAAQLINEAERLGEEKVSKEVFREVVE